MSWQLLQAMFQELYYYNLEQNRHLTKDTDTEDDSEWIEMPDFDNPGQFKKVKQIKNAAKHV